MKKILLVLVMVLVVTINVWGDIISQLIPCIIKIESNGNPNAISNAGCIGLMQINPKGAFKEWMDLEKKFLNSHSDKEIHAMQRGYYETYGKDLISNYTVKDLFRPEINLEIGEWYLRRLKNHYLKGNYTIERMLAAYNGGITRLRKVNYDINKMPKETKDYVRKVMKLYKKVEGKK